MQGHIFTLILFMLTATEVSKFTTLIYFCDGNIISSPQYTQIPCAQF